MALGFKIFRAVHARGVARLVPSGQAGHQTGCPGIEACTEVTGLPRRLMLTGAREAEVMEYSVRIIHIDDRHELIDIH